MLSKKEEYLILRVLEEIERISQISNNGENINNLLDNMFSIWVLSSNLKVGFEVGDIQTFVSKFFKEEFIKPSIKEYSEDKEEKYEIGKKRLIRNKKFN